MRGDEIKVFAQTRASHASREAHQNFRTDFAKFRLILRPVMRFVVCHAGKPERQHSVEFFDRLSQFARLEPHVRQVADVAFVGERVRSGRNSLVDAPHDFWPAVDRNVEDYYLFLCPDFV